MNKNLIGIVTFGNLEFTKLTVQSIRETVKNPYELYIVIGKPEDTDTLNWLNKEQISHMYHDQNYGFPYSVNDIYDYAWKKNNFDTLTIIGNDVIALPYAIDSLIEVANTTDFTWICSRQLDCKSMVARWPKTEKYFTGSKMIFEDFTARPWDEITPIWSEEILINSTPLSDVHNLALYKREVFDTIGYIDVNFYPAYYEDNDYVRRAVNAKLKSCTLDNSIYFHFWSRTIHQGEGGSNGGYFANNRRFYTTKWGGNFGKELWDIPFRGVPHILAADIELSATLNIISRDNEKAIIDYWK